jgi:succinate dehydrogenase / fumarate reductase flavoprotein subunit/fumarate reductase flavoprotein subunit
MNLHPEVLDADILILGGGGAAVMAALHATQSRPAPRVVMAVKGLLAKSGCTRMVQGGFNAVLDPRDSFELHFEDTVRAGAFINDQELAWILVTRAPSIIIELENKYGVFFDRNPDGTIHQKPFAGQSFDRTVHKGDLTGIEIMERLRDALIARESVQVLEDHRAVSLVRDKWGQRVVGALLLDMRTSRFLVVRAAATLLATGGGPNFYRMSTPSREKSLDGLAMAYRAGAELMDLEMIQFHPTALVCPGSELNGAVLEEGLRGAGAYLFNNLGERFMARYDPLRLERATRDVVARACYLEIMEGRGTPNGGVWIDISHLGAGRVEVLFPGMVERTRLAGFDLASGPVEVSPAAHFIMGGVRIDTECRTSLGGLFAAGEDAAGVQGANRLGGNGVAESLVFGALAGDVMREERMGVGGEPDWGQVETEIEEVVAGVGRSEGEDVYTLLDRLRNLMWAKVGVVRDGKKLEEALSELEELAVRAERASVHNSSRFNVELQQWLNLRNLLLVARLVAVSALFRQESRGAHYRTDFPGQDPVPYNVVLSVGSDGLPRLGRRPVKLSRLGLEVVT